jgi:hypothetical protein
MALTVEDGTVVAGANSYVPQSDADAYLALMGVSQWASLSSDEKDAKLARGFLIVNDGATYIYDGNRVSVAQEGEWPRIGANYGRTGPVIPDNVIPAEMKRAQIVAAGGLADGTIASTGTPGETGLIKSRKVDTLEVVYFSPKETGTTTTEAGNTGPFADLGWPAVTAIVAPLLDIEAYEDATPSEVDSGGVDSAISARRGPAFTLPSYGGIWDVGMQDHDRGGLRADPLLSNQQI